MDPFTLFVIASTASAGLEGLSQSQSMYSQAGSYSQQARAGEQDILAMERTGAYNIEQMQKQGRKFKSQQQVNYLKSGVDISSGSPLAVLAETAMDIESDIQNYRYNLEVEKSRKAQEVSQLESAAKKTKKMAPFAGLTSMLGSVSNLAMSGYKGKKAGA